MARPITPQQAQQNRDFLTILRGTGNARLAAREAGAKYGTMQHRRRVHPAFATRRDAALVEAQARLAGLAAHRSAQALTPLSSAQSPSPLMEEGFRTLGGEAAGIRGRRGHYDRVT